MKILTTLVDYKVNQSKPILRVFGRGENGNKILKMVSGCEPHLFTNENEISGIKDPRIVRYEPGPPSLYGAKTVKVICNIPADVSGRDENIKYVKDNFHNIYQSDILFGNVCKIEYGISGIIEVPERSFISKNEIKPSSGKIILRRQYLDIETIGGSINDAIKGKSTIPCLTVFDNYLNQYHLFTTILLSQADKEKIKEILKTFWVTSFNTLKSSLQTEKEEEKLKNIDKQVKYLEKNLQCILSFTIIFHVSENESSNLDSYSNFCIQNRPDVQAGWNNVAFDSPAIINRMKNLKLQYNKLSDVGKVTINKKDECNIEGLVLLDLMSRYVEMQLATPSHKSLDYISRKELGVGKLTTSGYQLATKEPLTFLAYNIVDVMLCVELDKLLNIIDFYVEVATLTNSNLSDMSRGQYIDNLILSFCNGKYVLPTRATLENIKRMSGAIVYDPSPGLHKNVILLDFAGMYPSIMKSLNISPETKDPSGSIIAANGVRFTSKRIGIIPQILIYLGEKRTEYKTLLKEAKLKGDPALEHEYDLKQYAIKVIQNAFYGVLGYKKFRLVDRDVGDAVTSTGRALSMEVKAYVESLGYKVIYGDTDSLLIELPKIISYVQIKSIGEELANKINIMLPVLIKTKFNSDTCYCKIEADDPYHTLVMLPKKSVGKDESEVQAKKRYAGMIWKAEGKYEFKVKGLEYVKGNTAEITRFVQGTLLKNVLDSHTQDELSTFLKNVYDKFFNNEYTLEQIGKPGSLRKHLNEYASDIDIKRSCEYSNLHFKKEYGKESSFMLYHLSSGQTDVIALDYGEPLPSGYKIDMQTTFEKLIISPTETILQSRNLDWSYIKTGYRPSDTGEEILSTDSSAPLLIVSSPKSKPIQGIPKKDPYDMFL